MSVRAHLGIGGHVLLHSCFRDMDDLVDALNTVGSRHHQHQGVLVSDRRAWLYTHDGGLVAADAVARYEPVPDGPREAR